MPSYQYTIRNYRVTDGDSVWTQVSLGFDVFTEQSCRLVGIDAPEHSTAAGKAVRQVVEVWIANAVPLSVVSVGRDKYAARYDGIIFDRNRTESLNEYLLKHELARAYVGGKRPKWLKRDLLAIEQKAKALLAA